MVALRNILIKSSAFKRNQFSVMVILVCWQVFTRYVLSSPATWTEEFVSYVAWMALLVLHRFWRDHMNIPVVVDKMSLPCKNLAILRSDDFLVFRYRFGLWGVKIVTSPWGK